MNELCQKSAYALAKLIRHKEVSSAEVVQAHLDRIAEVNPIINAITIPLHESALRHAKKADRVSPAKNRGIFHGVPFTVKENIDLLGTPTTQGLQAHAKASSNPAPRQKPSTAATSGFSIWVVDQFILKSVATILAGLLSSPRPPPACALAFKSAPTLNVFPDAATMPTLISGSVLMRFNISIKPDTISEFIAFFSLVD